MAGADLPRVFFRYATAAATTGGPVAFAVSSVQLVRDLDVRPAMVPLVYAAPMLVEAIAALVRGGCTTGLGRECCPSSRA